MSLDVIGPVLPDWGILVESHRHDPGFRTAQHRHRAHSLIFVVSGQGLCRCGGREHALRPNTAILLRGLEPHQIVDRPRAAMVVFVVYFSAAAVRAHSEVLAPLAARPWPVTLPLHRARRVRSSLRELLFEQSSRPPHFRLAMRQALAAMLLEVHRAFLEGRGRTGDRRTLSSRDRVRMVLDTVAARYYSHHSLADAARMAGLSQRQFSSLCRAVTGQSYLRHVNGVRVRRARELIEGSGMPVSAAAFEVGFEDLSTFYRAFRRHGGSAPRRAERAS